MSLSVTCVIQGEDIVFDVDVPAQGRVTALKKNIQKERERDTLRDVDPHILELWKLKDTNAIVAEPADTLLERIRSMGALSEFAEKLEPMASLSKRFPTQPSMDYVHIIVKIAGSHFSLSGGKPKVPIVDESELLHKRFWGQNRITYRQELAAEIIDLSSANFSRLNPLSIKFLLVREEYRIAYDNIIAQAINCVDRIIILLTGQPGIGKTFFLFYFLIRQLQGRKTVALQVSANEFVFFDQSGGIWALSDSYGKELRSPCISFQLSRAHLLHTSSPSSSQWKEWVKQLTAEMYVMDIWSKEEIRILFTVSSLDGARGLTLFNQYGSDIRMIVAMLKKPIAENMYLQEVESAAASVVANFPAAFQGLMTLDFGSEQVSSKIFTLRPRDLTVRNKVALSIQTTFLLKTLAIALCHSALAQKHAVFAFLNAHPTLRSPAGWMFEIMAHIVVGNSKRSRLRIYDRNRELSMPAPEEMISGNTALRSLRKDFRSFYWRPRESNYEGVDAVLRNGDTIWALQYTVSRKHRAATKGLAEVHGNMNHISKVKWHLVMIGSTLSEAESARDSQKLPPPWDRTIVCACVVQLDAFDQIQTQLLQDVLDDDVVMGDY